MPHTQLSCKTVTQQWSLLRYTSTIRCHSCMMHHYVHVYIPLMSHGTVRHLWPWLELDRVHLTGLREESYPQRPRLARKFATSVPVHAVPCFDDLFRSAMPQNMVNNYMLCRTLDKVILACLQLADAIVGFHQLILIRMRLCCGICFLPFTLL